MKMVKSLLLGSAAGLVAMAGAQAADLPVKAKPVQYVKICSLYGAGFYYIPGTDMCLKIGGYVRQQVGYGLNGSLTNGANVNNVDTRATNNYVLRSRGYITADARNQTEYGTVRSYIAVGVSTAIAPAVSTAADVGANGFNANRAFIQFAGFTFGLTQSFYDYYSGPATSFFGGRPGPQPKIVGRLRAAKKTPSVTEIVTLVGALQSAVARAGGTGVLVCVDELGKFLEYQARHRDAGDIFLLQSLAEHAMRASEAPLYLVTLLHQSFELYAQGMGEQLKNEWKKVQGRFESIPFVESTEQTIRVVAAAINQEFDGVMRDHVAVQARGA